MRVKYEVAMMDDIHHGRRARQTERAISAGIGARWPRWIGSALTMPPWKCISTRRRQGLVHLDARSISGFIDVRSLCVLGFALQPERNYNARTIRTL